jgi:hypothetical protein
MIGSVPCFSVLIVEWKYRLRKRERHRAEKKEKKVFHMFYTEVIVTTQIERASWVFLPTKNLQSSKPGRGNSRKLENIALFDSFHINFTVL